MDDLDEPTSAVGIVPVDGRGSMPFALLHGESLVAVASWALGEAGVQLLDFTESWAEVQARATHLVVHDPLCPATPVAFLAQAVQAASAGAVVVGVRPVTDTVKQAGAAPGPGPGPDQAAALGDTVDRSDLVVVTSPVVLPAEVVAALPEAPTLDDLAALVEGLAGEHRIDYLEAPPLGRRVADPTDLQVLEALTPPR